jgi:hypothetical protein
MKNKTIKVSECCGADPTEVCNEDTGFCPDCRDHTEFIEVCVECGEEDCVCAKFTDGEPVKVDADGMITEDFSIGMIVAGVQR